MSWGPRILVLSEDAAQHCLMLPPRLSSLPFMLALMDLETSGITKQNNIEISRRCSQNTRIVARHRKPRSCFAKVPCLFESLESAC
jgi:hypothetical protein